jgi:hypothetical protein
LKGKNIFTNDKTYYSQFKTNQYKLNRLFGEDGLLSDKMRHINSVLSHFGLKVIIERIQTNGIRRSYYKLGHINNISEIIEYMMKKGHKLYDPSKIYKKPKEYIYTIISSRNQQL